MSPHDSLRMRSLVSTFHLRPDPAKARLASSPPSLPLTQKKRLPPRRPQKSWPISERSTPEHRPALHWPCPSRQTVPCRAASPPCLCCVGPWSAAPCSRVRRRRVGAAVRDGRSGTCVASRVALLTVRRKVTRKEAPPVHTHARHTQPRALSHCAPARGYVRLACDGARVLAALGGLDSSGVACAGTSSEEAEAEASHARAKTNHQHVPAGKVRVRLDTRGYITRLAETGVQVVLFRRTAGSERTGPTKS
jgi:hypothetical protein